MESAATLTNLILARYGKRGYIDIGEDWASFTDYLADQVAFADESHWREKDESRNWPNLCNLF